MNAIYGGQFYRRFILELFKNLCLLSFENLFFAIISGLILYMECQFGHSYGRTYKTQLSTKDRHKEVVFYLNDRLNAPLNLKKKLNPFIRIFIRNTLVLALKISKRGLACILGRCVMVRL